MVKRTQRRKNELSQPILSVRCREMKKVFPVDIEKYCGKSLEEILNIKKVDKYTRAGKNGRIIICPKCNNDTTVYHFSWSALTCQHCKKDVDKYNWKTQTK